jgi:myo-inositol-1(or 4)-monophosphatase
VPADPLDLLALAERLARQAATLVRDGRTVGLTEVDTKSSQTDMVTEFDRRSEAFIVSELRAARPHDGIVGEEGTDDAGTSGIRWLVDPIDGTTNYLYALPGYAVSIAAQDEHGSVAGAVAVPTFAEVFTAVRGGGARCNGTRLHCSDQTSLAATLVATGFSYQAATRVQQAGVLTTLIGRVRDIRRFGAASVDLCAVGAGRVDAYYEVGLNAWDLAAGELVAREAGAVMSDFRGGPARPGEVVCAAPGIHEALLALLAESGALDIIHPPAS